MLRSRLWLLGCVCALIMVPICRAEDAADADILKSKDLSKVGTIYELPVEQELANSMRDLRKLKVQIDADAKVRHGLEAKLKMAKGAIANFEFQKRRALEEYLKLTDVTQKNQRVATANLMDTKIGEVMQFKEDVDGKLKALNGEAQQQFVDTVLDLSDKVVAAQDKYKELAADSDVKAALEKLNQPGKPHVKLGPSSQFVANANMLKRWRKDVSSDVIPIKHENEVPIVEVILNGKVTRTMVLDSGASMVCLTDELAKQLNMIPGDKDPTIHFQMADGKVVEARQMTLKSVKVGPFTVSDVECAVLPPNLVAAEPLLGGTFLNNFIFKLDPKADELHLAVIAGNLKVKTAGAASAPKKAGAASAVAPKPPKSETVDQ